MDRMVVKPMESTPPGNPFLYDPFNMGTYIGKNVAIMFRRFDHQEQDYIIVVDTSTGERLAIRFPTENNKRLEAIEIEDTKPGEESQEQIRSAIISYGDY